jgi:hypothetical protein
MWLLVYEATLKGWIPSSNPCFVTTDEFFGPMLKKRIKFYDETINVTTTKKEMKLRKAHDAAAQRVFRNIDLYF